MYFSYISIKTLPIHRPCTPDSDSSINKFSRLLISKLLSLISILRITSQVSDLNSFFFQSRILQDLKKLGAEESKTTTKDVTEISNPSRYDLFQINLFLLIFLLVLWGRVYTRLFIPLEYPYFYPFQFGQTWSIFGLYYLFWDISLKIFTGYLPVSIYSLFMNLYFSRLRYYD